MKSSLAHRLIGLCVLSTLTIAAFALKRVWWGFSTGSTGSNQTASSPVVLLIVASLAVVASFGTWREKAWAYILAVLLCAFESIGAIWSFYTQPAVFRFGDILSVVLSVIPVAVGMLAGVMLLAGRSPRTTEPNQALQPTGPSARG